MAELLHPSLRLLLRFQQRARWRKLVRSAKTVRGLLAILFFAGLMLLYLVPMIAFSYFRQHPDPARIRPLMASGFFALTLLTVIGNGPDGGIFFFPAEVEFLFPAPLERRQLLLYRIISMAFSFPFAALFGAAFASQFVAHSSFAFAGFFLMLEFNHLVAIALGLAISISGQATYGRVRRVALAGIGILAAIGVAQTAAHGTGGHTTEAIRQFATTIPGTVLFAPFEVFARTAASEHLIPDFAGWFTLGLGLNLALTYAVLRLDANFLESSAAASEKTYKKLLRARAGQGLMHVAKPTATRRRIPMPARLGGAGPIVWRQAVSALRGLRGLLRSLLTLGIILGVQALTVSTMGGGMADGTAIIMLSAMTVMFLPQMLQFDFRGDLERIDALKALPVSPLAIAAGELAVPVIISTAIEAIIVLLAGLGRWDTEVFIPTFLFLPFVNTLIFGIENLIFLWYPRQTGPSATMDLQSGSRRMLVQFLKMFLLAVVGGTAAAAGAILYFVFDSWTAAIGTAWSIAGAGALAVIPLLAVAFRKFDPSRDTTE